MEDMVKRTPKYYPSVALLDYGRLSSLNKPQRANLLKTKASTSD